MRIKKVILTGLVITIVYLICTDLAFAWNPITHENITQILTGSDTTRYYGTGPDLIIEALGSGPMMHDEDESPISWADCAHSPNLKIDKGTRRFIDKANFAYIMLKTASDNTAIVSEPNKQALGWGSHIAADWAAHCDTLFPVCQNGSQGSVKHLLGETLCDIYSFITRPEAGNPNILKTNFDVNLIYKTLFNYRIISIHEYMLKKGVTIDDKTLKESAKTTTLPKSYIQERIKRWTLKVALLRHSYACTALSWGPIKSSQFIASMRQKGIEENLRLSELSASVWLANPTARGCIPDYRAMVLPYYGSPLLSPSERAVALTSGGILAFEAPINSSVQYSAQSNSMYAAAAIQESNNEATILTSELQEATLWDSIANACLEDGSITLSETQTADGLDIAVSICDPARAESNIRNVVSEFAENSFQQNEPALLWNSIINEGINDPDILTDIAPPAIEILSPIAGTHTRNPQPVIEALIHDEENGSGLDMSRFSASIDSMPINGSISDTKFQAIPGTRLSEGLHSLRIDAPDKAGHSATASLVFTVDTIAPKLCYRIMNGTITTAKPRAEIAVTPDEPVTYRISVLPVINGVMSSDAIYETVLSQQPVLYWYGIDSSGKRAPNGSYTMRIEAIDRAGNQKSMLRSIKVAW